MEKQLILINQFLSSNFGTLQEALLIVESLKSSDLVKYQALQLLLQDENEQDDTPEKDEKEEQVTLPESVKVNRSKWSKSLKNSNARKGFSTLTGLAKDLEGVDGFQMFNVQGTEVRVTDNSPIDTKIDSYISVAFIYSGKLVNFKSPISKLSTVEHEVLEGLPFQFSVCEYVETIIDSSQVNYIKYAFAPM